MRADVSEATEPGMLKELPRGLGAAARGVAPLLLRARPRKALAFASLDPSTVSLRSSSLCLLPRKTTWPLKEAPYPRLSTPQASVATAPSLFLPWASLLASSSVATILEHRHKVEATHRRTLLVLLGQANPSPSHPCLSCFSDLTHLLAHRRCQARWWPSSANRC